MSAEAFTGSRLQKVKINFKVIDRRCSFKENNIRYHWRVFGFECRYVVVLKTVEGFVLDHRTGKYRRQVSCTNTGIEDIQLSLQRRLP